MTNKHETLEQKFAKEMIEKTLNYQKKFKFDSGKNQNSTWNNEADAFKHAFMQAVLTERTNAFISELLGNIHEWQGHLRNQPKGEENMDKWNNYMGRKVAKEINTEIKNTKNFFTQEQIEDMFAVKINELLKNNQLITNPNDIRKFNNLNQNAKYNFTGYTNPETGSDMVFSRENISNMNADEFLRYEKDIMNQLKTIGIPFDRDLQNPNSGTVFVKSYVRSDGTKVKSHYRSIK